MDTPRLLVMRVWPEPGCLRGLVREIEPEQHRWFTDTDALRAFLSAQPDTASTPHRSLQGES